MTRPVRRPRLQGPHVLGVDDGPLMIRAGADATLVAVAMEGAHLVEGVAVARFPVDGDEVTTFLADWIAGLRVRPALRAVVVGGITIAGLGVVDVPALARALGLPVLTVTRRDPRDHELGRALVAAGLGERLAIVQRTPPAVALAGGGFVASAGTTAEHAAALVAATRAKSVLPEPLRLAHLIARAVVRGESRGRP